MPACDSRRSPAAVETQRSEKTKELISEVKDGHQDKMADDLHKMCDADRKDVATRLKKYQQENPQDKLPKLDFYSGGDLKSTEERNSRATTTTQYDEATGSKRSVRTARKNGEIQEDTYDPKTRRQVSEVVTRSDGTTHTIRWDGKTGRISERSLKIGYPK